MSSAAVERSSSSACGMAFPAGLSTLGQLAAAMPCRSEDLLSTVAKTMPQQSSIGRKQVCDYFSTMREMKTEWRRVTKGQGGDARTARARRSLRG